MKKGFLEAVLIGALLIACFSLAGKVDRCYPALGLRWHTPLTQTQVETLCSQGTEQALSLSFWREEKGAVSSSLHSVEQARAICFYGEGALCYPADFLAGGYPGGEDVFGCALSESLAWQLFGSNDVVGQQVRWADRNLTVRGVFSEKEDILLVGARLQEEFSAAELSGALASDRRTQAQTLVQQAGLPQPDSMVYGPSVCALATGACLMPLALAFVLWGKSCASKIRTLPPAYRQVLWWGIGLGAALCLPFLLGLLPTWMIPARWSDFSFWPDLIHTGGQCLDEWLSLVPGYKDVLAKRAIGLLTLCSAAACCITVSWYHKARAFS